MMEHCVNSARQAGVFKEFHVLTDRPLENCECYDAYQVEKTCGLFKLHYLKAGMSRLNFDYFVWLDADSVFVRNPIDILGLLGNSPIHLPLVLNLTSLHEDRVWQNLSMFRLRDELRKQGVPNQLYLGNSAFWVAHHDAIDTIYDLAMNFWHTATTSGLVVGVSEALGYAMQMLCADPEAHLYMRNTDLWASDDEGRFRSGLPDGKPWRWRHLVGDETIEVRPSIIHLPHSRELLSGEQ
jgi:hypothetical protein